MHSVTGRQLSISQDNLLRTLHNGAVNCEHLIYYTEQGVESWLNCVAAINCDIAVQDFLQDLGIGDKTLTVGDQFLEQALRIGFVRMRCADHSQAVRLPKEFQFSTQEVFIRKEGSDVVLSPRPFDWSS